MTSAVFQIFRWWTGSLEYADLLMSLAGAWGRLGERRWDELEEQYNTGR